MALKRFIRKRNKTKQRRVITEVYENKSSLKNKYKELRRRRAERSHHHVKSEASIASFANIKPVVKRNPR